MDPVRIAVDAHGGDRGTPVVVQGLLEARRRWPDAFCAVLCGDGDAIREQLRRQGSQHCAEWLGVEHCPDTGTDAVAPSRIWRRHPESAMVRSVALQRDGAVDATVSAGDTGGLMATALFVLGKEPAVLRPALAATVPTSPGGQALLLDIGANVNCRAEHLIWFARLGAGYMRRFFSTPEPRVALLNVGEEQFKGPPLIAQAHEQLGETMPGYIGFIEASRVLSGYADVIVCDGFAGNVMLKMCESFYAMSATVLSGDPELLSTVTRRMAVLNAENYGAVPFLGIRGIVLKAHGRSSAHAIACAIGTTISVVRREAIPLHGAGSPGRCEHSYAR